MATTLTSNLIHHQILQEEEYPKTVEMEVSDSECVEIDPAARREYLNSFTSVISDIMGMIDDCINNKDDYESAPAQEDGNEGEAKRDDGNEYKDHEEPWEAKDEMNTARVGGFMCEEFFNEKSFNDSARDLVKDIDEKKAYKPDVSFGQFYKINAI